MIAAGQLRLSPEEARHAVARLMSDGRERTCGDITLKTGIPNPQLRQALGWLSDRGMIESERLDCLHVYRKAPVSARQEA